jgi:hypothetical protein
MKKLLLSFLLLFSLGAFGQVLYVHTDDLPVKPYNIYENNPFNPSVATQFRDGYLVQPIVIFGPGNIIPLHANLNDEESPRVTYFFEPQQECIMDTFKIYFNGGNYVSHPTEVWARKTGTNYEVKIAEYASDVVDQWRLIPIADSNRVPLDYVTIIGGVPYGTGPDDLTGRGLGDVWGSECRFAGRYKPIPGTGHPLKPSQYGGTFGTHSFYWDIMKDDTNGIGYENEVTGKTDRLREMGLEISRVYIRHRYNEPTATPDVYAFSPGGTNWHQDSVGDILHRVGAKMLLTTMGSPLYIEQTWPDADSQFVTYAAHGFGVGWSVRGRFTVDGFKWLRCNATLPTPIFDPAVDDPSYLDGVILRVPDADHFVVGEVAHKFNTGNPLGLLPNTQYWMSTTTSGPNFTSTMPGSGYAHVPVFKTDATGEATVTRSTNPYWESTWAPCAFEDRDRRTDPNVYMHSARLAWVQAAREGRNTSNPDYLMGSYWDNPAPFVPDDHLRKGTGSVDIQEPLNEVELDFWTGPFFTKHYMSPEQMAAFMSAYYDADMGRMVYDSTWGPGVGIGVKNADPSMMVSMPGLSNPSPGFLLGMFKWIEKHRGYKPDGTLNIPFDIVNYHNYSIDVSTQYGGASTGMPVELSQSLVNASNFQKLLMQYTNGMPYMVTEIGWDYLPLSRFQAPAYGRFSTYEAVGNWDVRARLAYCQFGIKYMTYFKMFADDSTNPEQFRSMAQVKMSYTNAYQRYPNADYMAQTKWMSKYYYDSTRRNDSIYCLKFRDSATGLTCYPIWSVEQTYPMMRIKFVPGTDSGGIHNLWSYGFVERTGTYRLYLPGNPLIRIKTLVPGHLTPDSTADIQVTGGYYDVNYNAVPTFIQVLTPEGETSGGGGGEPPPPTRYFRRIFINAVRRLIRT